jgi:transposase-like protein
MIQRMSGPDSISATRLAKEVGISQSTLSQWLREAGEGKRVKRNRQPLQEGAVRPDDLPPTEKLRLVMEASTLSQEELGEFLRRNGIHGTQLEQWRQAALGALQKPKVHRHRKSPEAKRIEQLERELYRKDKALAEVTALLALKKKLDSLLGDGDEGTTPRSER